MKGNDMNESIKAQWVAALRSGEYEQGQAYLQKDGKFCCLGVLCDLAVKAGVITVTGGDVTAAEYGPDAETLTLPDKVMDWAGTGDSNPEVLYYGGRYDTLASLNDNDVPFGTIADLIEDQL
jgi:hypothetical protein